MRTESEIRAERREMANSILDAQRVINRELRLQHPDFDLIEHAHRVCDNRRFFIGLLDWVLGVVDSEGNPVKQGGA